MLKIEYTRCNMFLWQNRSAIRLEVAQQELQAKQMEGELGTQTEEQAELEAAVQSQGMGALFRMGKLETESTMRKV